MMQHTDKILVAGAAGMVGSAIIRVLLAKGYSNIVGTIYNKKPISGAQKEGPVRLVKLDLMNQASVRTFFQHERPKHVFLAAAKVGGIHANSTYPAEFIHDNLVIQANVIHSAYLAKVNRLLFLGSSCIYPRDSPQPMKEEYLLAGPLEPTNEPYAVAKIAGIKMCQSYNRQYGTKFAAAMPTNLYGPGDNFDLDNSHVLPALIRKFHEAKQKKSPTVTVWGTGSPKREFMHVNDMADASVSLMETRLVEEIVNIGIGEDISIGDLARLVQDVVCFEGGIVFDESKPDGSPRKLLDISKLNSLNWSASVSLLEGVKDTYKWYLENFNGLRF